MRSKIFYLIIPRRELLEIALKNSHPSLTEFILPTLWTAEESDRGELRGQELDLLVKVLYSGTICNLKSSIPESSAIFEEASPTAGFFDRHWTIQRIPYDMTAEMALNDAYSTNIIRAMAPTGNASVDEFLVRYATLRDQKNQPQI